MLLGAAASLMKNMSAFINSKIRVQLKLLFQIKHKILLIRAGISRFATLLPSQSSLS